LRIAVYQGQGVTVLNESVGIIEAHEEIAAETSLRVGPSPEPSADKCENL
jgi:hypothetical protein